MLVSELIEWLKDQDQGAIVEVVMHENGHTYYDQGGNATTEEFTPEKSEYTDWRSNRFVKESEDHYGTRTLLLGELNG